MRGLILLLICVGGCKAQPLPFHCTADQQCGAGGRCVAGACAFRGDCPSGWRFDRSAGELAGACVPLEPGDMSEPPPDVATPPAVDLAVSIDASTGLALGGVCSTDADCASGHCTDHVCCTVPACSACNVCGGDGVCHPKATDTVDNRCAVQDPSTCGTNGHCDGAGQCAFYGSFTVCDAPHCDAVDKKLRHPTTTYCTGGGAPCRPQTAECTVTQGQVWCCVDKSGNVGCCASL
jgi:hypothetical protein